MDYLDTNVVHALILSTRTRTTRHFDISIACTYECVYVRMCVRIRACARARARVCVCVCVRVRVRVNMLRVRLQTCTTYACARCVSANGTKPR